MKKTLVLLVTLFSSYACVMAQDTILLKAALCRLETSRNNNSHEIGTGIVIGRQADTLFLMTAGHVLRNRVPNKPVLVRLHGVPDTLKARVLLYHDTDSGYREDLAICSVVAPGYNFPRISALEQLPPSVPVFYYHRDALNADADDGEQLLITWSVTKHTYRLHLPKLQGGDSGTPVFTWNTSPQLIGIALNGDVSCEVLQIGHILQVIKQKLPALAEKLTLDYEKNLPAPSVAAK